MGENFLINAAAREYNAAAAIMPIGSFRADNFWRRLFSNWKTLAIAAVLGAVCGTVAYFVVPKKWQSTVIVRVGDARPGHEFESELLEQMSLTASWIRSKEFVDALMTSPNPASGSAGADSADAKLFRETLTAKEIPGSQLLRVDYLGYSHHQLQAYVDAIGGLVRASHDKVMGARLEALKGLRYKYDGELAAEERRYQGLRRKYEDIERLPSDAQLFLAPQARAQIYESVVLIDILNRAADELDQRIAAAGHYAAVVTQAEIYVDPVFPKLGKFLPPAILLGILCGFIFSVLRGTTRFVLLA